jgi:hypothetical protein
MRGTFRKTGGPPGGGYGLILRDEGPGPRDGVDQTGRFYVFEVSDIGDVGIWQREFDHWNDLVPWTPADSVHPAKATNELEARAVGSELTFIVNGVSVAIQRSAALTRGGVGIFVGGDLNEVIAEHITVSVP